MNTATNSVSAELSRVPACTQHNIEVLCELLKAAGIETVALEYSGSGDEGSVTQIDVLPDGVCLPNMNVSLQIIRCKYSTETNRLVEIIEPATRLVADGLNQLVDDLIAHHCHSGYEDGSGGGGTLTLQVTAGRYTLNHYDNVIEQVESAHSG